MDKPISKRKLKSYKRAEIVCQELRYQLTHRNERDEQKIAELLISWMKVTGNLKFERPYRA